MRTLLTVLYMLSKQYISLNFRIIKLSYFNKLKLFGLTRRSGSGLVLLASEPITVEVKCVLELKPRLDKSSVGRPQGR